MEKPPSLVDFGIRALDTMTTHRLGKKETLSRQILLAIMTAMLTLASAMLFRAEGRLNIWGVLVFTVCALFALWNGGRTAFSATLSRERSSARRLVDSGVLPWALTFPSYYLAQQQYDKLLFSALLAFALCSIELMEGKKISGKATENDRTAPDRPNCPGKDDN